MTPTRHTPHPDEFARDHLNDPTCPYWFERDDAVLAGAAQILLAGYDVHEYCAALARHHRRPVYLYAARPVFISEMTPPDVPEVPLTAPLRDPDVHLSPRLMDALQACVTRAASLHAQATSPPTQDAMRAAHSAAVRALAGEPITSDYDLYALLKLHAYVSAEAATVPALRLVPEPT